LFSSPERKGKKPHKRTISQSWKWSVAILKISRNCGTINTTMSSDKDTTVARFILRLENRPILKSVYFSERVVYARSSSLMIRVARAYVLAISMP
jgi:hypothetical protein